ncbi:dihydrolipoamide acetyltransferase family protein [Pseudomonas jinjuensis]|uniref:Dihydrolipoamide acetyltransferase component of pyruvate dehydrogenase complex n=1 Tax=Pseudomonas jinjuensis TaxID=198616 RepID=A0A1G9Z3P6_9PSED|nr:dihydrolipoamide acetyltransferase family protein [Pseudomonas jinjuensis]SDN15924.1 2-oxoisovalerate dehydrogenase E2 component (dihydrolipoyl transacylase) [Pseudomonas jinjuensis]
MGIHVIKMPDIGEGIAEVELVEWHVQVGDEVHEDQVLAEVMTDKATVEIPSPVAGKILALGGQPGQVMAVGGELIRLEVEGQGNLKEAAQPKAQEEAPAKAEAVAQPAPQPARAEPRVEHKPVAPAVRPAPTPAPRRAPGEKPLASPAVRQRARDLGVELQFVQGSGPAGRILQDDLEHYLTHGGATVASGYAARHDEQKIPVIGLRRQIARKMAEAKRRIPHFSYVEEIDVTDLEALRQHLNGKYGAARGKLTLLPFIARAMVVALREFPQLNARYDDEADVVTRYGAVHLGVATQSDSGLMVPVLRNAESRDLWGNSAEVARLAEAARHGKASREELSGSTITLSSLGALGGIVSTPVINHPEVAIVGVNRMVERPMVVNGQIVVRKMMNLSSSFDHRVVDGMDAAAFIQAVRALLEHPATLFLE